jgi:hypothetical protein
MTWHAKALRTSYIPGQSSAPVSADESGAGFPYPCASWFFVDPIDIAFESPVPLLVCLGDPITNGSGSTTNGDDRCPDVLSRAIIARHGRCLSIVNKGIGARYSSRNLRRTRTDHRADAASWPKPTDKWRRSGSGPSAAMMALAISGAPTDLNRQAEAGHHRLKRTAVSMVPALKQRIQRCEQAIQSEPN